MDIHQLASLGCKFLGIYALLESIKLFGNIFQMYSFAGGEPDFGISVVLSTSLPFILMFVSAIALILFSNKFAGKMTDNKRDVNSNNAVSINNFQSIAFSIVGLILIILSLPKMTQIGWNLYAIKSAGDERNITEILHSTWSFALATGVQFVIGFALFIGAELFSSIWSKSVKRIRYERNIT